MRGLSTCLSTPLNLQARNSDFSHICPAAAIRAPRNVTGQPTDHTWSIALAHKGEGNIKETQTKNEGTGVYDAWDSMGRVSGTVLVHTVTLLSTVSVLVRKSMHGRERTLESSARRASSPKCREAKKSSIPLDRNFLQTEVLARHQSDRVAIKVYGGSQTQ